MQFLEDIDRKLFFLINGAHTETFDGIMWTVSEKWFGIPFYALVFVLLVKKFGIKNGLIIAASSIAVVGLADLISVNLFKNVFERARPTHNLEIGQMVHVVDGYRGGAFGFISSHAANMFALATVFGLALGKRTFIIATMIASLIAYSRVYLGVHYPSDVLVGGLLGLFLGFLVFRLVRNFGFVKKA